MSLRKKKSERCSHCLMRVELCICSSIPSLDLATRLVVVMSKRELITPTNTGRLASQALTNSVVLVSGDQDRPFHLLEHLMPDRPSIVLYPSEGATVLTEEWIKTLAAPVNLIVPDGNWRQTSKMVRRVPHMSEFPVVKVGLSGDSQYKVRKEAKLEGLATIEAIARALGVLEGAAVQKQLEQLLDLMVSRTMASRGVQVATI
ncbi:MAG: DTW domain-containing protein [Chitinophagaceae bacterium]|nr:DTW domain-containing protein [Oligoflexus sp.]